MAITVDPKNIYRRISHYGPYIFFYNGNCPGFNKSMVEYMNKMASEHPYLCVFQMDWQKYTSYRPDKQIEEIYKVYLYCNNKKEDEKLMPDKKAINEIFGKAIVFHNKKVDIRAKNIGKKAESKIILENDDRLKFKLHRRMINNKWKRKSILKTKVISKLDPTHPEVESIRNKSLLKYQEIINNFNCKDQENTIKLTNKNSSITPWFCNTNINDIPSDILSNEGDVESQDQLKNINVDNYPSFKNNLKTARSPSTKSANLPNLFSEKSNSQSHKNISTTHKTYPGRQFCNYNKIEFNSLNSSSLDEINHNNSKQLGYSIGYNLRIFMKSKANKRIYNDLRHHREHSYSNVSKRKTDDIL